MPAVGETLRVEGLSDLNRAFALADRKLQREMSARLRVAAEPVRVGAEGLATSTIPRIGIPWSRMRIGVTRTSVYVAPKQRGTKIAARKRRNLATLLLDRAMLPSLVANVAQVERNVDGLLGEVGRAWEHV